MTSKTERFAAELSTAIRIQTVALHAKGIAMDVVQAHEAWAEHSDDYCAGWLVWRDEDPTAEILQALTAYQARHGMLKTVPLPLKVASFQGSNAGDETRRDAH